MAGATAVSEGNGYDYGSDDDLRHRARGTPDLLEDDSFSRYEIFLPAVQSLVAALGGYEQVPNPTTGALETIYRPGDSVLAVLKDLKKLWRKDDTDDERTVARCMHRAGAMRELVALLVECTDRGDWGRKVALVACDLIAALTWPIDVQQELKEMQDEPNVVTDYASLLRAQIEYKAIMVQNSGPLRCLLALMLPSLAKSRKEEKDERIISLGLHIVRNLLAIKDIRAEGTASGEKEELAHLQSSLIVHLDQLTYFQLVLTLASCADKGDLNQYNVIVLDILHLIFRSVKVKDLAQDQDRASADNLAKLLQVEQRQKAQRTRTGMTRHSRFGTTVAVRAGDQKLVLHKQNAITVNVGKMLDDVKRKRAGKLKKMDQLTYVVNLSTDAMRALQVLAKSFIKSCFNTFFASILRDIRMERSKIRDTDNLRTFYLARFFIEFLLLVRQREADKKEKQNGHANGHGEPAANDGLALGWVAEMAEMDSVRWVFARLRLTMEDRPPAWNELQACVECFTQILLLIDAMATSPDEADVEVAEILQHQLYYNGDILDSSLEAVTRYKEQSIGFLEAVVTFAYVLLRMLERYSKTKSFMMVRKRQAARNKRKAKDKDSAGNEAQGTMPEEYGNEEDEEYERGDKEETRYKEHQFTFKAFEMRFAQEAVVNTLLAYLERFREFEDAEQFKCVVGLMHRQIIKAQAEGLYFKVTNLYLFQQILDVQASLPKGDSTRDLNQLITFVLRKFFKRVKEDPFLIVEALASKARGRWKELSSYQSDEDDGMGGQKARIKEKLARGPAELEFVKKKQLSWSQQMEVVVAMLLQAGHEAWIKWIVEDLEVVLAGRTEIVLSTDGLPERHDDDSEDEDRVRNFAGPSKEAIEKFVQYDLEVDNDERKDAVGKDAHFRLMLKLLSFERTEEEKAEEQKWFVPASVLPANLAASIGALQQYLANPPTLSEDPKSLIRTARRRRLRRDSDSESEGSLDENGEPKPKERRKERRKKAVEVQVFKSAAFIDDSDSDDDRDAAFFAKEKELRAEMEELARKHGNVMQTKGRKKRKRKGEGKDEDKGKGKGKGKGTRQVEDGADEEMRGSSDDNEEEDGDAGLDPTQGPSSGVSLRVGGDESEGGEEDADDESEEEPQPRRKRRSSPIVSPGLPSEHGRDGRDGSEASPPATSKRPQTQTNGRRRVVDSDDEE